MHAVVTLDHTMRLAAAGVRGALPTFAGIGFALNADALYTVADAPEVAGSSATRASASRARFALEAARAFIGPSWSVHPTLELAARVTTRATPKPGPDSKLRAACASRTSPV